MEYNLLNAVNLKFTDSVLTGAIILAVIGVKP